VFRCVWCWTSGFAAVGRYATAVSTADVRIVANDTASVVSTRGSAGLKLAEVHAALFAIGDAGRQNMCESATLWPGGSRMEAFR